MVALLSQGRRELEMVEKGSQAVGHTGTCILDMEKVCRTLYRPGSGCVKDVLARVGWESQGGGRTLSEHTEL